MLHKDDHTPLEFALSRDSVVEKIIKKPIRRYAYPVYNFFVHHWIARTYGKDSSFQVDRWLWGQRGNDFETQRRRVDGLFPLSGKKILIAGCGTGRDIPSWLPYQPELIVAIDLFNYEKAWVMVQQDAKRRFPATTVSFAQADIIQMDHFPSGFFDAIGSDALFEHVKDLSTILKKFHELLKPQGILYATFGPLWYCWAGDHFSGYDGLSGGFNHLLLKGDEYEQYLDGAGPFRHSEHDGRTWIRNGLFSYLKPAEYIELLNAAGFEALFVGTIIEPRSVKYLITYKVEREYLERLVSSPLDLLITGMTIIYRKRS